MGNNNQSEYEIKITKLWESYFYPGTNVLKNKMNITDYDELKKKEAETSFEKLVELYENPIQGSFDKEHLKAIHKYIFGDLYEWAGEYRYVDMVKETGFTQWPFIDYYLTKELELMKKEAEQVHDVNHLADFLATYYVHLIAVHPFREGNGRSTREFLREFVIEKSKTFADEALELDWTKFNGDMVLENLEFSLVFRSPIEAEFRKALVPANTSDKHLGADSTIKM